MQPTLQTIPAKKLIGKRITTTIAEDKTFELWSSFMPRRKEIANVVSADLFSVEIFSKEYFRAFNPNAQFEKWAAVEVLEDTTVPDGMDALHIPAGLYAVFIYKGLSGEAVKFFQYIFNTWLPSSEYIVDNRPHFEIMGDKYKNNHPDSEEEVWVPVRPK